MMADLPEILLVEDSKDDRDLFRMALAESGLLARLTCAADAPDAVFRLNRLGPFANTNLPDLIVMDLGLPGLRGQTLLQVIRNVYGPRHIPVVVLTGSRSDEDEQACDAWGISDYTVKPQDPTSLASYIASLGRFLVKDDSGVKSSIQSKRRTTVPSAA